MRARRSRSYCLRRSALLALALVGCRDRKPAVRGGERQVIIALTPGAPAPQHVAVRVDRAGSAWRELTRAGMQFRAPRPDEPYLVRFDCPRVRWVIALTPDDPFELGDCPVADALEDATRRVDVTAGDHTLVDAVGPVGQARDTVEIPWVGSWDVIAVDDAQRIAIARGIAVPHKGPLRLADESWTRLVPEELDVVEAPATGTWDAQVRIVTAHGTELALAPTTRTGGGHQRVTLVVPSADALAPGDVVERSVSSCRDATWCVTSTTLAHEPLAVPAAPAKPIVHRAGADFAFELPDGLKAIDVIEVSIDPPSDTPPTHVVLSRSWLAARASGSTFTIPTELALAGSHLSIDLVHFTSAVTVPRRRVAAYEETQMALGLPE